MTRAQNGSESGLKVWHVTLVLTIGSFVASAIFLSLMIQEMHMDTILEFFNIFASVGIYGTWVAAFFFSGLALLVVTIVLGILKK